MKRLISIILCAALCCFQANATGWLPLAKTSGGGGYTGPGDVVSGAFAWWGMRCYNNAYAGNVADIVNSGSTLGTRLQCSSGTVSALVSGSACTFVTGNACSSLATTCASTCSVTTLYDQSGATNCTTACNATQATFANMPTVTVSCQNSQPCMVFNSASSMILNAANVSNSIAQPFSMSGVANRTSGTAFGDVIGSSGGGVQFLFNASANQFALFAGGAVAAVSATDNVLHAFQGVYNGASSSLTVDGSTTSSLSPGTNGLVAGSANFSVGGGNNAMNGQIMEAGVWATIFNGTQLGNMNSNQHSYWGF